MEEENDGDQAQTHESCFGLPSRALEAIRSHARLFGCLRGAASQTPFELSVSHRLNEAGFSSGERATGLSGWQFGWALGRGSDRDTDRAHPFGGEGSRQGIDPEVAANLVEGLGKAFLENQRDQALGASACAVGA